MENNSNEQINVPKKSSGWLIFLVGVLVILFIGAMIWWQKNNAKVSPTSIPATTLKKSTPTLTKDSWARNANFVLKDITSTCTIKLDNGNLRMYYMKNRKIVFADSTDGKNFGSPQSTGITEETGKMISNPAVLKIKDGEWIMIYEQAPQRQPGEKEGPPSPANQRNLYLATSTDGARFKPVGIVIDSSIDDNYFASVPDLVLLPDGKIRMYYVCGGDAICSASSTDSGKTWQKDSGKRLTNHAVDPDVLLLTKNGTTKYVMYYSRPSQEISKIYKSVSSDGLTWQEGIEVLRPLASSMIVIDPDVVKFSENKYLMYFGESSLSAKSGGAINLHLAEMSGNIF